MSDELSSLRILAFITSFSCEGTAAIPDAASTRLLNSLSARELETFTVVSLAVFMAVVCSTAPSHREAEAAVGSEQHGDQTLVLMGFMFTMVGAAKLVHFRKSFIIASA